MNLKKLNPLHIVALITSLIVIIGAVYAATTWGTDTNSTASNMHSQRSSQLLDQSHQINDIQASPSSSQGLTGGASSDQLQQNTSPGVQSAPSSTDDQLYPSDPNPCRGNYPGDGSMMMCVAP